MVTGIAYKTAKLLAPALDYNEAGLYSGQVVTMLRKASKRKWRLFKRTVPVPFRHYTPRITKGVVLIARLTPYAGVRQHFIALEGNRIHDPETTKGQSLEKLKYSKEWREWMVVSEIGENPDRMAR
jgi:hypothetical protein